ncbi:MAG: N-acetyl-D-Glu racemase DgcA [Pseudomonadota bacterium]
MKRKLTFQTESWPIQGSFNISRGAKTSAEVIVCEISQADHRGRGECVPYARYGETIERVSEQINDIRDQVEAGEPQESIVDAMPPGAARNAVDCALWDLKAKSNGVPVHQLIGLRPPRPVVTATTISLGEAGEMAHVAEKLTDYPLLKVKLGGEGDAERIRAVAAAVPNSRIILDANEAWSAGNISEFLHESAKPNIVLIEQPLPKGEDEILSELPRPVPICADESAHVSSDLEMLVGRYDCINVKLDKAGGLTEAIKMCRTATELGFSLMVGCMVGTSLGMAPAILLAQQAHFVDLDGPLILAQDREDGLVYEGAQVSPPSPKLWG